MTQDDLDRLIRKRLTTTTSLDSTGHADLVIEALPEDMKIKQDIWKKMEGICRPHAVFGTNTSALPITVMVADLANPSRLIGLHFFNPAHRMQLLEIIVSPETSNQTLAIKTDKKNINGAIISPNNAGPAPSRTNEIKSPSDHKPDRTIIMMNKTLTILMVINFVKEKSKRPPKKLSCSIVFLLFP